MSKPWGPVLIVVGKNKKGQKLTVLKRTRIYPLEAYEEPVVLDVCHSMKAGDEYVEIIACPDGLNRESSWRYKKRTRKGTT